MAEPITYEAWLAEARRRFGDEPGAWKFVCPVCRHVASVAEYEAAGAPPGAIGFSCVGRWLPECKNAFAEKGVGPCNYAGGGLFRLNPVKVLHPEGGEYAVFAFAEGAG